MIEVGAFGTETTLNIKILSKKVGIAFHLILMERVIILNQKNINIII